MHAYPGKGITLADGLTYLRDLQWRYECEIYVSLRWHRTASKGMAVWELRAAFPNRGILQAWELEVREPAMATKKTSEMGTLFQAVIRLCTQVEEHSQSKYWLRGSTIDLTHAKVVNVNAPKGLDINDLVWYAYSALPPRLDRSGARSAARTF